MTTRWSIGGYVIALAAAIVPAFASAADSERKPLQTFVPVYPEPARRERLEGDVELCFDVDREGTVHRVRVRRSSNRVFEKPAIEAAQNSTYKPLPEGAMLSGIKTCRTFRFRLTPVAIEMPS